MMTTSQVFQFHHYNKREMIEDHTVSAKVRNYRFYFSPLGYQEFPYNNDARALLSVKEILAMPDGSLIACSEINEILTRIYNRFDGEFDVAMNYAQGQDARDNACFFLNDIFLFLMPKIKYDSLKESVLASIYNIYVLRTGTDVLAV